MTLPLGGHIIGGGLGVTLGYASGKAILFGEHAVVYARPAIAVPVIQVRAEAEIEEGLGSREIAIIAQDLGKAHAIGRTPADGAMYPLAAAILGTLERLGLPPAQDITVRVRSTVPIARGLGSGAAVSIAIIRALAKHFGKPLEPEEVSELAYETERIHHGTPSGIDNTVIAYETPIYFVKGRPPERFRVGRPLLIAIADTGVASPTKLAVDEVRQAWQEETARYECVFDRIGEIASRARKAMEGGELCQMGSLMDANQALLEDLGVSSPQLDLLLEAAREGGALGAKLSGAGKGGNMIALIIQETRESVERALWRAGATKVIVTEVR